VQRGRIPRRGRVPRVWGYRGGRPDHASHFEDRVIQDLEQRGIKYEYEAEKIKYEKEIRKSYCRICGSRVGCAQQRFYTPDLRVEVGGSGERFIELKGKFTAENRARMEAVRKSNPDLDLRFLFQRDNWCTSKKKMRYSDWATKHGFKWAVGERIPDEWITSAGADG